MEWRRRGGKPRPKPAAGQQQQGLFAPSGSAAKGGNAAGNGGGFGFGQQTNSVTFNTQKATSSKESHTVRKFVSFIKKEIKDLHLGGRVGLCVKDENDLQMMSFKIQDKNVVD